MRESIFPSSIIRLEKIIMEMGAFASFPRHVAEHIKRRDGYRCQYPESGGHGGHLEAHHIIPQSFGSRLVDHRTGESFEVDDPSNGITLCREHHLKIHEGKHAGRGEWNREHDDEFRKRIKLNTK